MRALPPTPSNHTAEPDLLPVESSPASTGDNQSAPSSEDFRDEITLPAIPAAIAAALAREAERFARY